MVGIPLPNPQNQSKIVFSTRSQDVCHRMKARTIVEVTCLDSNAAWTLFCKEVGVDTLNSHPDIPSIAKKVAKDCEGLPLALLTLGRAMAPARDPLSWEKVEQDLKKYPAAISGMENDLFRPLKLSYDMLPDDVVKSCFLYCSMFWEDWQINCSYLIELWIGEGLLGEVDDMHDARDQGERIIKTLKHACLLEGCGSRERRVKLHDVIREMALWLYRAKKSKVLVYHGVDRLHEDLKTFKLKKVEKITIWDTNVEEIHETLVCPNLKTFIVNCKKLKFSNGFFQFMPFLRVLDISGNGNLSEVPQEIGKLNALTYLNLSFTRIKELPIELKQLKNLVFLLMSAISPSIVNIPQGLISSLVSLKSFLIFETKITSEVEETLLEELESLDDLSEIDITISSALSFNKLKSSCKLLRCMRYVMFYEWRDIILLELSSSFFIRMQYLQGLFISHCDELEGVKINIDKEGICSNMTLPNKIAMTENYFHDLKFVEICHCPKLLDLTWLVYFPFLEYLYIEDCESLSELLQDDGRVYEIEGKLDIFSRLRYLKLRKLPWLKSIYSRPLLLPSLESIKVYECESLRRLPFNSNTSTHNLRQIKGETSWWSQLEWDEEAAKTYFTRYFEKQDNN